MKGCNAKCTSTARLDGKTAIVTGCNTGIGKCTVEDFYKRGARVIMACRNPEKAEEAAGDIRKHCEGMENLGTIIISKLDLNSLQSVRNFCQKIMAEEDRLDLLINNAGVMFCPEGRTEDGFEIQFGTNHLGHFLLTLLLIPKLIISKPARIVNVSSNGHTFISGPMVFDDLNWERRAYSETQAYYQSKLANILFTKELARKFQEAQIEGVNTYCLHPGVINTDLQRHTDESFGSVVGWTARQLLPIFAKTPEQGSQTTIYCAVDEKAGNETGLYYAECKVADSSTKSKNMDDARKLWDLSMSMVGLDTSYDPFATKL